MSEIPTPGSLSASHWNWDKEIVDQMAGAFDAFLKENPGAYNDKKKLAATLRCNQELMSLWAAFALRTNR